jgi:hypothetical protein
MKNMPRSFVAAAIGLATFMAVPPAIAASGGPVPEVLPVPPAGQGQIVFWRPGSIAGATLGCGVNLGTERISALGRGKYFLLNLEPGAYEFNAKSEAKDTLNLEVESGEVYFVKCTIRMGIMVGRPNLAPSNLAEFAAKKGDLKYVDSDDVGPRIVPDPSFSVSTAVTEQPASADASDS